MNKELDAIGEGFKQWKYDEFSDLVSLVCYEATALAKI